MALAPFRRQGKDHTVFIGLSIPQEIVQEPTEAGVSLRVGNFASWTIAARSFAGAAPSIE
jgi:hypothetical protein